MKYISVIVPLYKCSSFVDELSQRLSKILEQINPEFEIIFVNDASPENDWEIVTHLAKADKRIKGISLSRNFGQHYAITAGLSIAKGEWIVVMDGDLQDVPEEIGKLHQKAMEGYDIVLARRNKRKDGFFKKLFSRIFYRFFSYMTDTLQDASVANFGIYHQKVIHAILSMKDSIRYFPTMSQWVGFTKTSISVEHGKRPEGESSYTIRRLFDLAFANILAFSDKPLWLTVRFGFLLAMITFLIAIGYLILFLTGHIVVSGFTSLILSIWFLSGIIIFILGIVGIYVGKTFEKAKDRPTFIIDKTINHA
jgi:dolichol-phosphate mannosyltransferase